MTLCWHGAVQSDEVAQLGPLALIQPLLDQLDITGIIDGHLPPDPQLEFSYGSVLSLLVAARLCEPTALSQISTWAEATGADIVWNIPADKLNDDRLGRALDAFFQQRHSIMASATNQALRLVQGDLQRVHFDPTDLIFCGAYESSQPRPQTPLEELLGDSHMSPAHIRHGYRGKELRIQCGASAVVDDLGAIPIFNQPLDGNRNGFTAIREQYQLLKQHLSLPNNLLMVSDRGTLSIDHVARLFRNGHHVLCSAPWNDYRAFYEQHAATLQWQTASFLSIEQRRRRECSSTLPLEDYKIAVVKHDLTDPTNGDSIPARLIFVRSSADAKEVKKRRQDNIAAIQAGLEKIAVKVSRAHPRSTPASITKQIVRLLGKKAVAKHFHWELLPLTPEEQAAAPPLARGFKQPTHRLVFRFDAAAAEADATHDGLAVLLTTAPPTRSGDELFTMFKQQNFIELLHHQWKTPLAVRPVFLHSPERVEALVCLMQIALQAYQVLERRYRQTVAADAPVRAQRMTAESLLRAFKGYGLLVRHTRVGRVIHATRLSTQQRRILNQLSLPTPAQTLVRRLPPLPTG